MARYTHKQKVVIAKHLRTRAEELQNKPIFETKGWDRRKEQIAARVKKREAQQKYHADRRRREKAEAAA